MAPNILIFDQLIVSHLETNHGAQSYHVGYLVHHSLKHGAQCYHVELCMLCHVELLNILAHHFYCV